MNDTQLTTLEQAHEFLKGTVAMEFSIALKEERYGWIEKALGAGFVAKGERLFPHPDQAGGQAVLNARAHPAHKPHPAKGFTREDIRWLAHLDELHGALSDPATKKLCERAYAIFGQGEYERLAGISVAYLYNLRRSVSYTRRRVSVDKTRPVRSAIAERRKPQPDGWPARLSARRYRPSG